MRQHRIVKIQCRLSLQYDNVNSKRSLSDVLERVGWTRREHIDLSGFAHDGFLLAICVSAFKLSSAQYPDNAIRGRGGRIIYLSRL